MIIPFCPALALVGLASVKAELGKPIKSFDALKFGAYDAAVPRLAHPTPHTAPGVSIFVGAELLTYSAAVAAAGALPSTYCLVATPSAAMGSALTVSNPVSRRPTRTPSMKAPASL